MKISYIRTKILYSILRSHVFMIVFVARTYNSSTLPVRLRLKNKILNRFSVIKGYLKNVVYVYTYIYNVIFYCIVLYWRGGHCCPMLCDLFKNLGITRTWIHQIKFCLEAYFWGLRFFNEPEISDFYVLK